MSMRGLSGFTLLEVMLTLAILAILTALAVPAFSESLAGRRVWSSARIFATALSRAQAEAVARNRNVEVLFTATEPAPAAVATASVAAASNARWMVRQVGATAATDYVDGLSLRERAPTVQVESTLDSVAFTPLGRPMDLSGGVGVPLAGPMVVRFTDSTNQRRVCAYLSTGGAIRVCDPSQASGSPTACQPDLAAGAC